VTAPETDAVCSAKGCERPARWALRWNNPRLHTPERRKIWVACDDHRESLEQFLDLRGFLKDTVPLAEAEPDPGPRPLPAGGAAPSARGAAG